MDFSWSCPAALGQVEEIEIRHRLQCCVCSCKGSLLYNSTPWPHVFGIIFIVIILMVSAIRGSHLRVLLVCMTCCTIIVLAGWCCWCCCWWMDRGISVRNISRGEEKIKLHKRLCARRNQEKEALMFSWAITGPEQKKNRLKSRTLHITNAFRNAWHSHHSATNQHTEKTKRRGSPSRFRTTT